jgi:inosine-uridine nucleoside N-ribohydrolase
MTTPVIFDTDAGSDIDDLYALALIVAHPELELLGVTTVAGDTQARARLVAKMLRLQGPGDVPVRAGIGAPSALAGRPEAATYRQNLTHCDLVTEGDPEWAAEYADGVEFILETLGKASRPVSLIGTGPWTNVAEVLRRASEEQKSKVECLALMGGEVHLLHSESNVKNDPEAADLVLASGVPIFLGTWSVTRKLFFTMGEIDELLSEPESPFLQALHKGTRMWWGEGLTAKPGPVLYDVVPAFWAAGERGNISCISLEKLPVELKGERTRGMTVTSPWQLASAPEVAETAAGYIAVTHDMDAAALKKRYAELVFES